VRADRYNGQWVAVRMSNYMKHVVPCNFSIPLVLLEKLFIHINRDITNRLPLPFQWKQTLSETWEEKKRIENMTFKLNSKMKNDFTEIIEAGIQSLLTCVEGRHTICIRIFRNE
jgi:hypothetical protein